MTDQLQPVRCRAVFSDDLQIMHAIIQDFEKIIERAPGQVAVIIRTNDSRIIMRDNSGVNGLTGEDLMMKCVALMDALFPGGERQEENAAGEATASEQRR